MQMFTGGGGLAGVGWKGGGCCRMLECAEISHNFHPNNTIRYRYCEIAIDR